MNLPTVRWLRRSQIRDEADRVLAAHHPDRSVPIPVEDIIDVKMGYDIIPLPGLERQLSWDAFLSLGLPAIHIDDEICGNDSYENRYRFTLAHELGHVTLHRQVFSHFTIRSFEEFKEFDAALSVEQKSRMDWQAHLFAGYLLAPDEHIQGLWAELDPELVGLAQEARDVGLTQDDYGDTLVGRAAAEACRDFVMSDGAMARRLKTGLDDGIIEMF